MASLFVFHSWLFRNELDRLIVVNILAFVLLTLSIIDYFYYILPDELTLSLLFIGIIGSAVNPYFQGPLLKKFLSSSCSALAGGLLMFFIAWCGEKLFKKEALGGGDIKLIAATAAVLGWRGIYGPLLVGSLTGGLVGLVLLLSRKKKLGETLPFGPFLSLGAYLTSLFPGIWPLLFKESLLPLISLDNRG